MPRPPIKTLHREHVVPFTSSPTETSQKPSYNPLQLQDMYVLLMAVLQLLMPPAFTRLLSTLFIRRSPALGGWAAQGLKSLQSRPSSSLSVNPPHTTSTDMIIRLGRLTPGYFRLLQRQVAGEVQTQPQDRAVNQIAMMLAIMGLSLSYYSAKQMTEKVQAAPAP
ncbi:hypothetical protein ABVT39_011257 [Epinephelus coioides]